MLYPRTQILSIILSLPISAGIFAAEPSVITETDYEIVLSDSVGSEFEVGKGVNMSKVEDPKLAPRTAFPASSNVAKLAVDNSAPAPSDSLFNSSVTQITNRDEKEEAKTFFAHFKASYGLNSVQAAASTLKQSKSARSTFYFIINYRQSSRSIDPSQIEWRGDIMAERVEDPQQRLLQFSQDYGTHYITDLSYGYRIAIRANFESDSAEERKEFAAAVKAGFGGFGAQGGLKMTNRQRELMVSSEVVSEITAGKIDPERPTILRTFAQIEDFLNDLTSGNVKLSPGPIKANVHSYWHTFDIEKHPRLRQSFVQQGPKPPKADFGVPKGTILAWQPGNPGGTNEIVPPEGWAICNGMNNTPNLVGSFLRGTNSYSEAGITGGSETHTHRVIGATGFEVDGKNASGKGEIDGPDNRTGKPNWKFKHSVDLETKESPSLPPFHNVVYIIKL